MQGAKARREEEGGGAGKFAWEMPFRAAGAGAAPAFKGATLLVADVARGNVGQLAADLLISTLQMQRVGYFDDPDVLPAVGGLWPCAHSHPAVRSPYPRAGLPVAATPAPRRAGLLTGTPGPRARAQQESRTENCA